MPGSVTHPALKANNASEWSPVYLLLGGPRWEGAARSAGFNPPAVAKLGDLLLQNRVLGPRSSLPTSANAWVTCGTGLESVQTLTDRPGSGTCATEAQH